MHTEISYKMLFVVFSLFIAKADIKTGAVPRFAFAFAFPFFFAVKILILGREQVLSTVVGMFVGLIVFVLIFITLRGRLGLADVWFSALVGLVFGLWWWYITIGVSCLTGIIYMSIFKKRRIPFIPFMALGSIFACLVNFLR